MPLPHKAGSNCRRSGNSPNRLCLQSAMDFAALSPSLLTKASANTVTGLTSIIGIRTSPGLLEIGIIDVFMMSQYPVGKVVRFFVMPFHNLGNPATEDLLYEDESVRRCTGISTGKVPDEITILNFRHLLERHGLGVKLLETINGYLAGQGLRFKKETVHYGCQHRYRWNQYPARDNVQPVDHWPPESAVRASPAGSGHPATAHLQLCRAPEE